MAGPLRVNGRDRIYRPRPRLERKNAAPPDAADAGTARLTRPDRRRGGAGETPKMDTPMPTVDAPGREIVVELAARAADLAQWVRCAPPAQRPLRDLEAARILKGILARAEADAPPGVIL